MRVRNCLFGMAVLAWPASAAKDASKLYDAATLQQAQTRYPVSTNKILNQVVLPALKVQELRKLAGIRIDYPLVGEGEWRSSPLAFYVPPDLSRVVFPILSLKFLDDLCTAYAWLQINGYVLDTISEYTAMLKYKDFPGEHYPPPLRAMHIPDNALEERRVDELARGHFVTARTFLLLHELGHIYSGRVAGTLQESQRNEEAADAFAAEVMSRTPLPPLGIIVFFMADASWADYPPRPNTHPLTGQRLRSLATRFEDRRLAAAIQTLGEVVDQPETGTILTAKSTDESTLAPRRGHLQLRAPSNRAAARSAVPFQGEYTGESIQNIDPSHPFSIEIILNRSGNTVTGQYSFGLGNGQISGTVSGNTLNVTWQWGGRYGYGVLKATGDGRGFTGTWGYGESSTGAGTWSGQRTN